MPKSAPSLESERLLLRPFREGDLQPLLAMHSRPEVARYLYWEPRDEHEVRQALARKLERSRLEADGDGIAFAAVLKSSSELIGDCSVFLVSVEHRQGEIGFLFHSDHQGHGYATEAARVLLAFAFDELALDRVVGRLEARNTPSARVLERADSCGCAGTGVRP